MNDILSGTYKGNTYRIKVECYPNTPAIKVQLLPVNAGERITMTQNLGQPLPRYQAFLCDGMLEVDSTAFMDYMEENDLGYIVDYKRYDADVFTGVNRRTAAVFQFHSAALRRLNKVGCQRYEGDYTRLKQKHAERRARRMAGYEVVVYVKDYGKDRQAPCVGRKPLRGGSQSRAAAGPTSDGGA